MVQVVVYYIIHAGPLSSILGCNILFYLFIYLSIYLFFIIILLLLFSFTMMQYLAHKN